MDGGALKELEQYRSDILDELLLKPPRAAERRHLLASAEGLALDYIEVLRMPRDGARAWATVRDWRDLCVRKVCHGRWRHMNEPEMNLLRRVKLGGVASYLRHEMAADARGEETEVFTMSYRGPDLEKWMALCAGGGIDPFQEADFWLRLVWHLLDTVLLPFHARGFVHCDLKPDNICLPANEVRIDGDTLVGYLDLRELSLIDLGSALGPVEDDERGRTRLRCRVSVQQGEAADAHTRYVSDHYSQRISDTEGRLGIDGRADLYSLAYQLRRLVLTADARSAGDGPWPSASLRDDIRGDQEPRAMLRDLPGLIWTAAEDYRNTPRALPHAALAASLRQLTPANEDRWFFRVPLRLSGREWSVYRTRAESALRTILVSRGPEVVDIQTPLVAATRGSTVIKPDADPATSPAPRPPPLPSTAGGAAATVVFSGEPTARSGPSPATPIESAPPPLPRIAPPPARPVAAAAGVPPPKNAGPNPYLQATKAAAATPPAVPASQASPRPASADPASEPVDAAPQKPSQGNAGLAFFLVFVGTLGFIGLLALFTDKSSNDDYAEYAEAATEAADAAAAADPAAMAGDAAADAAAAPADAVAPLYDTLPALLSVKGCSACSEMARIPEGSFLMGSPEDEADRDADEGPQHRVALSAFQIGRTEVTQAQWQAVMGENPSGNQSCGPACPVESVTVAQIDDFIARLNRLDPDWYYDLPTEAQWEYAARAATTTRYWWGNEPAPEVSGHDATDKATSGVDVFRDNAWGLYQVHGNVYEFTRDCYGSYPTHGAVTNGNVSISCDDSRPLRVVRGGAVANGLKTWRSAFRGAISPDTKVNSVGFRLMRRPREELKK